MIGFTTELKQDTKIFSDCLNSDKTLSRVQQDTANAYRVPGLPTSFFVDKRGVIRQLIMGQMTQRDIPESLELIKTW